MALTLALRPEVEARLKARADEEGTPVDVFAQRLVESALGPVRVQEAIELYDRRLVTQGQAAALAGLTRAGFIAALGKAGVSVFQYSPDELEAELRDG